MKCTNHPKIDATGQCSECGSFLCDACIATEDNDPILCEGCLMLSTLAAMTERKKWAIERKIERETEEEVKQHVKRSSRLKTAAVVALCIAVIEVAWYFSIVPKQTNELSPTGDILMTSIMINDAIEKYRENHEGIAPYSLEDLLGEYLPENSQWRSIIWDYTYNVTSPKKYQLIPPINGNNDAPTLIFSDEGIKAPGME